jgi:hypothetical protein
MLIRLAENAVYSLIEIPTCVIHRHDN